MHRVKETNPYYPASLERTTGGTAAVPDTED